MATYKIVLEDLPNTVITVQADSPELAKLNAQLAVINWVDAGNAIEDFNPDLVPTPPNEASLPEA